MQKALALLKKYWIAVVVLLIIVVLFVGYFVGYRFTSAGIVQVGTIEITGAPAGSKIYIDEARVVVAGEHNTMLQLTPGTHSFIVDIADMQPWNELATVVSGKTVELSPIQVPKTIIRQKLTATEIPDGRSKFASYRLPTKDAPLVMGGGCVAVYASGTRILAESLPNAGCTPPEYLACLPTGECPPAVVFAPVSPVRSLVAFPGRSDALVVAAGTLSYVVELDPRKPQFFAPLSKDFISIAPWDENNVLVQEAGILYTLPL